MESNELLSDLPPDLYEQLSEQSPATSAILKSLNIPSLAFDRVPEEVLRGVMLIRNKTDRMNRVKDENPALAERLRVQCHTLARWVGGPLDLARQEHVRRTGPSHEDFASVIVTDGLMATYESRI